MYEEDPNRGASRTVTLKSACSRKSLTCRSLSCNRSSVSLHTLTAESGEEDQLSSHPQSKTGAFCSPMVRAVLTTLKQGRVLQKPSSVAVCPQSLHSLMNLKPPERQENSC